MSTVVMQQLALILSIVAVLISAYAMCCFAWDWWKNG